MGKVGIRELRQNLSRHLARVKAGESLVVTERGREVALLVPSGESAGEHARLTEGARHHGLDVLAPSE